MHLVISVKRRPFRLRNKFSVDIQSANPPFYESGGGENVKSFARIGTFTNPFNPMSKTVAR